MSTSEENRPDNSSSDSPSIVEIVMMVGVLCALVVLTLMVVAAL